MCRKLVFLICMVLLAGLCSNGLAADPASQPNPPNNDWCVALDQELSWVPGDGAASHDVYFGKYYADVANGDPSTYQGNFPMPTNSFDPGPLKKAETYYWRVDAVGGATIQGEVWAFTATTTLCLKVDLAQVECPNSNIIRPQTAKPGWWYWATGRWADMYSHDASWACEQFPCPTGIDGTGITAGMSLIREGDGALKVSGLTMDNLAGGVCPHPRGLGAFGGPDAGIYYESFDPKPGPICNSWFTCVDWPEIQWGTIVLVLHDVPPGAYVMYSYHNQFSAYRWKDFGGGGESVPNDDSDIDPPMPLVNAMSVKDFRDLPYAHADSFQKTTKVSWDPGPWPEGVISLQDACNVPIQNVLSDDELNPSEIKFATDGSPVVVMYHPGSGHVDPVRTGRTGGRGILNAFVLMMMALDTAYAPSPGNGAENVSPNVTLEWAAGQKAGSHDVYLGTSFADVRDATTSDTCDVYVGPQPAGDTDYDPPGALEYGTTYYWKVDEVNESDGNSPWYGDVWNFTTYEAFATNPSPTDGAKEIPKAGVQLSWSAGYPAESHDVYLGTYKGDVEDATTSSPQFKGNQIPTTYDTGPLEIGKTYYWRIDKQDPFEYPYTWKGDVWEFATESFLVVDDMESYDPVTNWIFDTWLDGLRDWPPVNGCILDQGLPPDPCHGGAQSMEYVYDSQGGMISTAPYYSEAEAAAASLKAGTDWTAFGVKTLSLWFYGDPTNTIADTDQMYVGVEDATGPDSYAQVRYGDTNDMNDVKVAEWQQWSIDLQDFNDGGVNLEDVSKLYLGFGDRVNPVYGGGGIVFFDDMRLYLPLEAYCYRSSRVDYADYVAYKQCGPPFDSMVDCWCRPPDGSGYQCVGDADGQTSGFPYNYRVFTGDLNCIINSWKKKMCDPTLDPCADLDHMSSGFPYNYRVFTGDLNILIANWKKKDADFGIPGPCPWPE